jgi:hypothetical protein
VDWIAYHPNDYQFRSGTIESRDVADNDHSEHACDQTFQVTFDPPMWRRPKAIFHGFHYIHLPNDQNPRISFDIIDWDAKGFQAKMFSWGGSRFKKLKGTWLAVL